MPALIDMLTNAAAVTPDKELVFYEEHGSRSTTYLKLYNCALRNSQIIKYHFGVTSGQIILLHLDSQATYVTWFWSAIAAGAVPVVSTPLAADVVTRDRHLGHLKDMLGSPLVITTDALRDELAILGDLTIASVEDLSHNYEHSTVNQCKHDSYRYRRIADSVAFMMLTSGSTGGAKAVEITHAQVLAAIEGKSQTLSATAQDVFLNWIGFDHVACVTEIHLHAMAVGAKQVHLDPNLPIRDPRLWLKQMADHNISITFAPNFFLAAVVKTVSVKPVNLEADLSNLRIVISGGEANKVSTGIAFNEIVKNLGAQHNVVCPAFGMTETCAGSIYHLAFPELEISSGLEFCSVGAMTRSLEYRIANDDGLECAVSHQGNLQLRGPGLFRVYHNDDNKTENSFTHDGWFETGDIGYADANANLILVGRTKDSIIINGVKYFSHELEAVVEDTATDYLAPSYTAVFPVWTEGSDTEDIVVTFAASDQVPSDTTFTASDASSRVVALWETLDKINNAFFLHCSKKPLSIIPLPPGFLQKSALGKLSRFAVKRAFERGQLDEYDADTKRRLTDYRRIIRKAPKTHIEKKLAEVFASEFDLDVGEISVHDSLVDMGMDSIRLLRFRGHLQQQFGMCKAIPVGVLLANPTIRSLAGALCTGSDTGEYNPVVVLQSGKSRVPPIWFIHPGLGEVLVFLNISKYFSDRHVYALRAPGFNSGEEMFKSIDDMTSVYVKAIHRHQPNGPYILIGYSFGSMIAFETTKKLEAAGQEVFMGSLNGPPHIKWRMVQIDWCELILNLSYFLGFLTEEEAVKKSAEFHKAGFSRDDILSRILAFTPPEKLIDLDLDAGKLAHWADVSSKLQGLAHDYDPSGNVLHIDVFYAQPLLAVGNDKQEWLREHLHDWNDFSNEPARFHGSPGAHYTMLDPDHVFAMQKVLRGALRARGVL